MIKTRIEAKTIIFTSKLDIAAQNIKRQLLKNYEFREEGDVYRNRELNTLIVDLPVDSIYAENLEEKFKAELFIFASRHSAESGMPALLTHTPGNWTDNVIYGGKPRSIAIASPITIKVIVNTLMKLVEENNLSGYKVGIEVTHHGPYVENTPTLFVEVGSIEKQWRDEKAASIISETIIKTINERFRDIKQMYEVAVGVGGPHYAPIFTRKILETKYAIGHVIPEYVYNDITTKEIDMAVKRNDEKVNCVLIEWKGLKRNHREITVKYLEEKSVKWIKI
ncbi:MAG: hypothetical protein N3E39_00585 [Candidatus Methanomethylicia archaeon]|nr:hypothetical protein [Candidatus Methanomethylicia archaeon]